MKNIIYTVEKVITENPDKVEQLKERPTLIGWFVGQVMKRLDGHANPVDIEKELLTRTGIRKKLVRGDGFKYLADSKPLEIDPSIKTPLEGKSSFQSSLEHERKEAYNQGVRDAAQACLETWFSESIDWWMRSTKKEVSVKTCQACSEFVLKLLK